MEEKKYLIINGKQTKTEDLTGRKFGRLTVNKFNLEKYHEDLIKKKNNEIKRMSYTWICECECGTKNVIVENYNLKKGLTQSCGCLWKEAQHNRRKDLTGQKFNMLTVLYEDVEREKKNKEENINLHDTYWVCKCDCGNIKSVGITALQSGRQISCGCYNDMRRRSQAKDWTNYKFGRLTAIERDFIKEKERIDNGLPPRTYWKCICDCGNEVSVLTIDLTKNKNGTKSCGCLQKEGTAKANKKNGIIKNGSLGDWILENLSDNFIENYWSDKNENSPFELPYAGRNKIHIICDKCNKDYVIDTYRFTLEEQRCPDCYVVSKGEEKIKSFLKKNKIKYKLHKTFNNLRGTKNGLLSYDFYLKKYNLLIEYQGNFHDGSNGTDKFGNLETQQEHDRRKREYAKNNNIEMLEIWYWDFDNIRDILSEELNIN